jgi:UDP-glucose 4-epimerase
MIDYLVTGGAGFIGSNVVRSLLSDGFKVRVLDNFDTGNMNNITDILDKIDFILGSITYDQDIEKATKDVKNVIHLGARPSVPFSIEQPIYTNQVNIEGTLKLLQECVKKKVDKFIFASSSSVYGSSTTECKSEDEKPNPLSPYALQKLTGEYYCKLYYELFGLKTIAFRFFNVFGPRQNPNSDYAAVIPLFINKLLKGEVPTIHGGEQTRDFTYVEDVISGIKCGVNNSNECCYGQVYNLAKGDSISITRLFITISEILGVKINPIFSNYRTGDVRHSKANPEKIINQLGWKSEWDFETSMKMTVNWYKEELNK